MKAGIIGLGEVAQLMHIPVLNDMQDDFVITAVADVSPSLTAYIADKYKIKTSYSNAEELIKESGADVIFVLSPDQYHCEYVERALEAGKHVFVEKPAALYSGELAELIKTRNKFPSQVVMVGYMRRFADNFLAAKKILTGALQKTEYLRFRDIICEGPFFIKQTRPVFYPKDVPASIMAEGNARRSRQLGQMLGEDSPPALRTAYQMLTGLGCHSFSAVRELFG
ncbi:MAG: Gfo/Idh/MocA family oxidoreductase, partial [Treponema sp.]|nr:Gfo/Idh/MocA family oxidoreductase [Treponema sp.]